MDLSVQWWRSFRVVLWHICDQYDYGQVEQLDAMADAHMAVAPASPRAIIAYFFVYTLQDLHLLHALGVSFFNLIIPKSQGPRLALPDTRLAGVVSLHFSFFTSFVRGVLLPVGSTQHVSRALSCCDTLC